MIHSNSLSSQSSLFKFPITPSYLHKAKSLPYQNPPFFFNSHRFCFFPSLSTLNYKVNVNCLMGNDELGRVSEYECGELIVETCLTRTLPPALTLEHGLESLKEAVEELKLNPPTCTSGMIRFEVAVPPSAYALRWFCCQPESSGVFPQFYISKGLENPALDSAFVSKKCGLFGVGAAVDFNLSSSNSENWNLFRRYLLVDSFNITAYGFIGINYDVQSFIVKYETGSSYFVIPQVELNEYEGFCMLTGTLVWNDSFLRNFEQALHSYEISLVQARGHIAPTLENGHAKLVESSIHKFKMAEHEKVEMIYMEAPELGSCDDVEAYVEMVSPSS